MPRPKKAVNFDEQLEMLDNKIEKHQKQITYLKAQKKALLESREAAAYDGLLDAIKSSGKSPEEILSLLHNA